jgi:hypothetical protein
VLATGATTAGAIAFVVFVVEGVGFGAAAGSLRPVAQAAADAIMPSRNRALIPTSESN